MDDLGGFTPTIFGNTHISRQGRVEGAFSFHRLKIFNSTWWPWWDVGDIRLWKWFSSWWLNQPLWKIWSSNWESSPQVGVNIENLWNHQPVLYRSSKFGGRSQLQFEKKCLRPGFNLSPDGQAILWLFVIQMSFVLRFCLRRWLENGEKNPMGFINVKKIHR